MNIVEQARDKLHDFVVTARRLRQEAGTEFDLTELRGYLKEEADAIRQLPLGEIDELIRPTLGTRPQEWSTETLKEVEELRRILVANVAWPNGIGERVDALTASVYQRSEFLFNLGTAGTETERGAGAGNGAAIPTTTGNAATNKDASWNVRMIDTMQKNPKSRGWTSRQWGEHLGCSAATVINQPAWDELMRFRAGEQMARKDKYTGRKLPKKQR